MKIIPQDAISKHSSQFFNGKWDGISCSTPAPANWSDDDYKKGYFAGLDEYYTKILSQQQKG